MFQKLYLERTGCYGTCPIFYVEVYSDGTLNWNGEMFVSHIGKKSFTISEKKIQKLNDLIESFDYRHYTYEPGDLFATDHPHCITRVEFEDGFVNEVDHYLGNQDSFVNESKHSIANLEKFENKVEQILGIRQLIKQTLYIYHVYTEDKEVESVVSAPNQEKALEMVVEKYGDRDWWVRRIGRDTTGALWSYVVIEKN
ncbi:DUF6438 domain-containing protein [Salinibacillus xinjiangensis]|uniref:DUF6438 domain-containing protein n=1 Tax=Salinibacillus xinjiangensis TaxID=1229268 RepID=A0A6G1X517_9BACI|nr:DUF6438 domain-containing protein [Salinibacillus xinjiangensis]MRG85970.1 hypothetical protein [Salinibacillus xinjiangensis]